MDTIEHVTFAERAAFWADWCKAGGFANVYRTYTGERLPNLSVRQAG